MQGKDLTNQVHHSGDPLVLEHFTRQFLTVQGKSDVLEMSVSHDYLRLVKELVVLYLLIGLRGIIVFNCCENEVAGAHLEG